MIETQIADKTALRQELPESGFVLSKNNGVVGSSNPGILMIPFNLFVPY